MQARYDEEKGIYRDCRFCGGKGCLACPGEAEKAYKRQYPDGPQPIATFKVEDIGKVEDLISHAAFDAAQMEGRQRVDEALSSPLVSAIYKAIPCAPVTEVMKDQAASVLASEIVIENIAKSGRTEYPPIDSNRRCCMPPDRDCVTVDNVRIMYCRVCRLIISKQDISNNPPTNVLFAIGERLDKGMQP